MIAFKTIAHSIQIVHNSTADDAPTPYPIEPKNLARLGLAQISSQFYGPQDITVYIHGVSAPDPHSFNAQSFKKNFPNLNEDVRVLIWNHEDTDAIHDSAIRSLWDYWNPFTGSLGDQHNAIKRIVKNYFKRLYKNNLKGTTKRLNIIGHSLGGQIVYDVLRELEREIPDFRVHRFITVTAANNSFNLRGGNSVPFRYPTNIDVWDNVYSPKDGLGLFLPEFREPINLDPRIKNYQLPLPHTGAVHDKNFQGWLLETYRKDETPGIPFDDQPAEQMYAQAI